MAGTRTPGWTNTSGSDPGITILEVIPFLAIALFATVMLKRSRKRRAGSAVTGDVART